MIAVVLISSQNLCMGNANGGKYPCKYSYLDSSVGAEAVFVQSGVLNSVNYSAKREFVGENYRLHLNIAGLELRSSVVVRGDAEAAQGPEPPWPGLSLQLGEKWPGPSQGV